MERKRKKYEELTIVDDFMFGKVMRNPKHCKKLLEIILDMKIREIVFIDEQQTVAPDYKAKGVRIDVYADDDADTVYAVEMQARNTGVLPIRSRYYQAVIDINLIEKGMDYEKLGKNYIIFICTFDLFGKGRHIYHFENLCIEDTTIRLNDGTEKIFLNTKGKMNDADKELINLLKYFDSLVPQDAFTEELDKEVLEARLHRKWRHEYMKLEVMMWDSKREGIAEGMERRRIDQICRKLVKGKTPEEIAEDLEEDSLDEVQHICDIAAKYAPNYDIDEILQEYMPDIY
ncbi:MAG: Rpn family recombination-promoting nuclease/putative transposase [Clostridiales bacterium]|nr:Rpn family recombination-promoting nuclease/putative transposase [Clostridiales bacterium]